MVTKAMRGGKCMTQMERKNSTSREESTCGSETSRIFSSHPQPPTQTDRPNPSALILSQPFPPGTSNDTPPSALKIPYQALSLHATQRVFSSLSDPASSTARPHYNTRSLQTTSPPDQATLHPISALYLQLDPSHHLRDQANPDDEDESTTLDLFIIPAQTSSPQDNNTNGTSTALDSTPPTAPAVTELFAALTRCADLNPDPVSQDADTDGDVEAHGPALGGFPGEGGWITAENAGEFDGHSGVEIELGDGGAILGPGAGLRRGRDGEGVDGEAGEEAKWRRMG